MVPLPRFAGQDKAMIDAILAIKFVHVLLAAVMLGAWLVIAAFMVFAKRSRNASVIALIAQFVVRIELFVMAGAIASQPISGFPLAMMIGLNPADEFWIVVSLLLYAVVVAAWLGALWLEFRIRRVARQAVLAGVRMDDTYSRLYRIWLILATIVLGGMVALFLTMVWQPRLN
jgi:uncharacterized membrane protein